MMNLQNLRMKRILRILIVVFVFLYFLSFFSTHVCAENNFELEKYFETVRGQLLSFYNAEVTAHAGIILGLLVALGSIGKDGIKALFSNKKFSRCLSLFAFIIIIFFILYSSGRLFYWSGASSALIGVNSSYFNDQGIIITGSNATMYMKLIGDYSVSAILSGIELPFRFAQFLHPDNFVIWFPIFLVCVVVLEFLIYFKELLLKKIDDVLILRKRKYALKLRMKKFFRVK